MSWVWIESTFEREWDITNITELTGFKVFWNIEKQDLKVLLALKFRQDAKK